MADPASQTSKDDIFSPLLDARLGLVRSVRLLDRRDDLPSSLCRAQAEVSDSARFSSWHCDDRSGGFAWDSAAAARGAALGEAVERYSGNLVPAGLRRASFEDLAQAGEAAIDPESLALFSDHQYATPGFPFVPFTRSLPVLWTQGESLLDGRPMWVPASMVWVTFWTGEPTRHEPKTHATPYAGIAAGPDRLWAETSALFELIERDAASWTWHGGAAIPPVAVPPWLRDKVQGPGLRLSFYRLPNPFEVPVLAALAHDEANDLVAMGLAARAEPVAAALKAAAEALQLIITSRILDDPTSPYMRQVQVGAPGLGVKPWRKDRGYRKFYRRDWRDAWDLLCHLQIYHDPRMRSALKDRLGSGPELALQDVIGMGCHADQENDIRQELIRRLAAAGHEPVAVDVTTPDVAPTGLRVVRVVAPGLYGNAPAAFPYLGGPRLASARASGSLCRRPIPYA